MSLESTNPSRLVQPPGLDKRLDCQVKDQGGDFPEALRQAVESRSQSTTSSPLAGRELQAVKALVQMQLLDLNTTLLRALSRSSARRTAGPVILNEWPGLTGWADLAGLSLATAGTGKSDPAKTMGIARNRPSFNRPESQSFDEIIEGAAAEFKLDPNLVRAVIKTESDFDSQAVSQAGAMGLMQLMPETAQDLGVDDAFDPVQNIFGGARYLRQMLDRYGGNLGRALSAYNWGPGNLERSRGFLPEETQNYLVRVNRFYKEYMDQA